MLYTSSGTRQAVVRSGAGSIPARERISYTVEAATLIPEDEQLTVDAAITPARILPCQVHHQQADRANGARPARAPAAGTCRVAARQQVPVPAQHRLGPHQQLESAKHIPWEPVQQGGQERPVARAEPRPDLAQVPLQHRDLVTQRQDLHLLVPVAQRKQPQ
jgi:hypothetical protein